MKALIAMETRMVADYLIYVNYTFNKAFLVLLSSDLIRKVICTV